MSAVVAGWREGNVSKQIEWDFLLAVRSPGSMLLTVGRHCPTLTVGVIGGQGKGSV